MNNKIKISPIILYSFLKDINFNFNNYYSDILFNNKKDINDDKFKIIGNLFSNSIDNTIPIDIYKLILLSLTDDQLYNLLRFININLGQNNRQKFNINNFRKNKEKFNEFIDILISIKENQNYYFILNIIQEYFYC